MKKPVQRLDPVAVFVAALIGAAWVQAAVESEVFEVGASPDEELNIVRCSNRFAQQELQRQIDAAAERDARGEP